MKNFAIVIGHTKVSQGAKAIDPQIPAEWTFNNNVAQHLADIADIYHHDTYAHGYTSMVKRTAEKINKNEYKLVLELHYNAGGAGGGTEVLFCDKSVKGQEFAKRLEQEIVKDFGTRPRGAKVLKATDRGFGAVYYPKFPTILSEPFFGSYQPDCDKFRNNELKYSQTIRNFLSKL